NYRHDLLLSPTAGAKTYTLSLHDALPIYIEYITLSGTLCETPGQRVYEHHGQESWHTLARLDVDALQRGTNWQPAFGRVAVTTPDRKSTRLNSSHVAISYAGFCLKKKTRS